MGEPLHLGCFSVSLAIADLDTSLKFYRHLGYIELGGEAMWRILDNDTTKDRPFAEHIDANILTFKPGLARGWVVEVAERVAPTR